MPDGSLLVADTFNDRLRLVTPASPDTPVTPVAPVAALTSSR
jgi:hypothetical protein